MTTTPEHVDTVLDAVLQPEDDVLLAVRAYTSQAELPAIEVSAQQGKLLELLVRTAQAKNVLEIGTLGGYSTVCLSRGTGLDGYVTSLEYEHEHAVVAHSNLRTASVHDRVCVLVGDAHETLPELDRVGARYDFIFIDADKESNLAYFQWADKLGTDDVTIVVDNVIRDGRVLAPERPDKLEFLENLGRHPNFDVSVVQTVGSKGWDGFVLAKRKANHG